MKKPFGYSYYLDMYGCKPGTADDHEDHFFVRGVAYGG
jgi:hypothetical protein